MARAATASRWIRAWPFCLVALVGLAVRLPQLGARPMHTDEAVNAYIVGQMLAGEPFIYDAQDRHGPALAALALPASRMQGARAFRDLTESELRIVPVVAGTVTILLFGTAIDMFGFANCLLAAALFAVAPLPVYYDRYFIHESLFCAATFGLILASWHAWKQRSAGYGALAGACAALMLACKETAVLHFLALGVAAVLCWFLGGRGTTRIESAVWKSALAAAVSFAVVFVALLTWFGRNWKALPAFFQAGPLLLGRAGGQGHEKPFWYFARLLTSGWSGPMIVCFGCVGLILIFRDRDAAAYRWIAIYGLILGLIYSAIPYKTPWLALNCWLPITLCTASAAVCVGRWSVKRWGKLTATSALCILAIVAVIVVAHDTRARVFRYPADERNPYAYAHTSEDILGLSQEIADWGRQNGVTEPRISVIASDAWPLPWYLRRFSSVGFWPPGQHPGEADVYITSTDAADQYTELLHDFRPEFFGVRPGVLILLWTPAPK